MTDNKPAILESGERARLFPVLADTSKEGRALSILLACLESVDEFGKSLLADFGVRSGVRTKIETYTEIVLKKGGERKFRPDGLIVLKNGSKTWTALVEAKIGNADLNEEQLESYLELAKQNGVDALITISNQFAPLPSHHPVQLSVATLKKATLRHWSWMYLLTQATLQYTNGDIQDKEQRVILNELARFLSHKSTGVRTFDQMPTSWVNIASAVQSGRALSPKEKDVVEVVGAWHEKTRDLCLTLSRQIEEDVDIKVSRAHAADPTLRLKEDAIALAEELRLQTAFSVPNSAAPMQIVADFQKRSIFTSMRVNAPTDRKSTKARLSWLLRQLVKTNSSNVYVKFFGPGRGVVPQFALAELQKRPELADQCGKVVTSFEITMAHDLGGRFAQPRKFVEHLEKLTPAFYEQIGQQLKNWQPRAPKVKADVEEVNIEALRESAELAVAE